MCVSNKIQSQNNIKNKFNIAVYLNGRDFFAYFIKVQ